MLSLQLDSKQEEYTVESAYLSGFTSILGIISVSEKGNFVYIGGMNMRALEADISNRWKTTRLTKNMFTSIGYRSAVIHKFYIVELLYMLEELQLWARKKNTPNSKLRSLQSSLFTNTWVGEADSRPPLNFDYSKLNRLTVTMLPDQMKFFEDYAITVPKNNLKGNLLHGDAGVGKTLAGIGFHLISGSDCTIYLVPKPTIEEVWVKTIINRFKPGSEPKWWHTGMKSEPTGKEEIIVVHYEQIDTAINYVSKYKNRTYNLWLDESHNFNEKSAARTTKLIELGTRPEIVNYVPASGTPYKVYGSELMPTLRIIDKYFTEAVAAGFVKAFGAQGQHAYDIVAHRVSRFRLRIEKSDVVKTDKREYMFELSWAGAERFTLDAVRAKMQAEAARLVKEMEEEKEEVYEDFHLLFRQVFNMQNTMEDRAAFVHYKNLVDDIHNGYDPVKHKEDVPYCNRFEDEHILPNLIGADKKRFRYVKGRYKYPQLVIRGILLGTVFLRERIDCFNEIFRRAHIEKHIENAEKKTLIFSSYIDIITDASNYLMEKGYKTLVSYGDSKGSVKEVVDEFTKDPSINPLLATYKTLGTGVPVTAANLVIMIDPPYREYIKEQAVSRCYRLDQDATVHVVEFKLITGDQPNLSTRGVDILQFSKESVDKILGTTDDSVTEVTKAAMNAWAEQDDPLKLAKDAATTVAGFFRNLFGLDDKS